MKFILNMLIVFAITFAVAYWFFDFQNPVVVENTTSIQEVTMESDNALSQTVAAVENIKTVNDYTAIDRIVNYTICGHQITDMAGGKEEYVGKTYDQLMAEGWQLVEVGSNKIQITVNQNGLCPSCDQQRVIIQTNRGIAIYTGTIDSQGDLLMELPIDTTLLPEFLQIELNNGGYELQNQATLNNVLESLDEYLITE